MKCKHDIDTNYYCMACDKEETGQDELPVDKIVKLPKCPFCSAKNKWQFLQFGIDTNYYRCKTCYCQTPPKITKKLAKEMLMKLAV